jgi:transmembrane sensor
MKQWDQAIFEKLISDNQFISWVRGGELTNSDYWNSWKNTHPDKINEFDEAVRTVESLNFRHSDIHQADIQYLWNKTSKKINQSDSNKGYRRFILTMVRVAAILTLPLLLVSSWLYYNQNNLEKEYSHLLENKTDQKVTVIAPIGARIMVELPDGSKAWLNSGSELTYPIIFNINERRVKLIGEAYFKVQKDEVPFFVSSLGPEIKVYGTEFNVNSYTDEENVTVALVKGKVSLELNGKEEFLAPGQISTFDKGKSSILIGKGDVSNYSSWRDGKYIFRNTTLSSILRILQRQHNVSIQLMNPDLGNYRYNATINNESLEQILQLLSISAPIKYNYKHKEMKPDGTYENDKIEISADKTRIIKN